MEPLSERYRTMPDEQLLKAIAEQYKYQPDAVAAAKAEALSRGFNLEDIDEKTVEIVGPMASWISRLTSSLSTDFGPKADADILDWMPETDESSLAVKQWIRLIVIFTIVNILVDAAYDWFVAYGLFDSLTPYALAFFILTIIPALILIGLLKHLKIAFQAATGLFAVMMFASILQIYEAFMDLTTPIDNSLLGLIELQNLYTPYPKLGLATGLLSLLLSGVSCWLMCKPLVYGSFRVKENELVLIFIISTLLLALVQIVLSLSITYFLG